MPEPVILICPCCASRVDAQASDEAQQFLCVCGQSWSMVVDAERCAAYSLT